MSVPPVIRIAPDGPAHVTLTPKSFLGGALFQAFRSCIEGATFDPQRKCNRLTRDRLPQVVQKLKAAGFQPVAPQELHEAVKQAVVQAHVDTQAAEGRSETLAQKLAAEGKELYPFQRTGTAWLAPRHAALLADEMGLGKTIQTLAALPSGDARRGALVVAPSVGKGVWQKECKRWRPDLLPSILQGRGSFRWPRPGELLVMNYDILVDVVPLLDEPIVLIADEAHMLKNYSAARTKKFRVLKDAVIARGGRAWLLTATPLLNHPPELWGVLSAAGLAQEAFGSWKSFEAMFNARKTKWGTEWGLPTVEVNERLQRVMLRRLREDVLPDLPPKTWQIYECALSRTDADAIGEAIEETGVDVKKLGDDELPSFEKFSGTRAALARAKIPTLLRVLEGFEGQGEPVVVFSAHRAPVDAVRAKYGERWAYITGDTTNEERSHIETEFQAGKYEGLAATIQAAGVALTLTRSHQEIFVDRTWTPAMNAQAEDREARIGQKSAVVITDLVAPHPLDEHLYSVLLRKQRLIDATMKKAVDGSVG